MELPRLQRRATAINVVHGIERGAFTTGWGGRCAGSGLAPGSRGGGKRFLLAAPTLRGNGTRLPHPPSWTLLAACQNAVTVTNGHHLTIVKTLIRRAGIRVDFMATTEPVRPGRNRL
jgi:hypothetical protein